MYMQVLFLDAALPLEFEIFPMKFQSEMKYILQNLRYEVLSTYT
jgi:hypothetical protein